MRRTQTGGGGAFAASALIYPRNASHHGDCMSERAQTYIHTLAKRERALYRISPGWLLSKRLAGKIAALRESE
jgi:hypothetical protein